MARKKSTKKAGKSSKPEAEAPPALPLEEPVVEPVVEEKPVAAVEAEPVLALEEPVVEPAVEEKPVAVAEAEPAPEAPADGAPTPDQCHAIYETAGGTVHKLKREHWRVHPETGAVVKKVIVPKS